MDIAWVGSGSADGFFHQGIHSWDMAAGAIIVKEAGGTVLSTDGGRFLSSILPFGMKRQ